jgi:hypothetical protein
VTGSLEHSSAVPWMTRGVGLRWLILLRRNFLHQKAKALLVA